MVIKRFDMTYDEVYVTASSGSLFLNDESQKPNYIKCGKEMTYHNTQIVLWSPGEGDVFDSKCNFQWM